MGGYGAYKFGLSCPEKFAAVAGIAGSYHAEHRYQGKVSTVSTLCEALYGDPPEITPEVHDIFTLLERLSKSGQKIPRLYICCGTEDGMYRNSEDLKNLQINWKFLWFLNRDRENMTTSIVIWLYKEY